MEENKRDKLPISFTYTLDEEKWVRLRKGFVDALCSRTMGRNRVFNIRILLCFVFVEAVFQFVLERFWTTGIFRYYIFFMPLVFLLMLLFRNREREIRIQVKSAATQKELGGKWLVTLSEEGISRCTPDGLTQAFSWEKFGWLVEGEFAFYVFQKDKKDAVLIPKECFGSWETVWAMQELVGRKGLIQVKQRKCFKIPVWCICLAMLAATLLGGFVAAVDIIGQILGDAITTAATETADSPEYRNSTSFGEDEKAYFYIEHHTEVLRALGLTVPEGAVRSLQETIEDPMFSEIVTEPEDVYLQLLMNLAWGYLDEEGNLVEGTGEVFWFDFEGMDVSTDYIYVLEGMLALAEGSPLDGIGEIEEDIGDVDWERGRGTVTVSLTWEGQKYEWDMKVYYDWIDSDVLGILNSLLRKSQSEKYFYIADDGGQGVIVFFCTKEWAEKFTKTTHIKLVRG